jgi:hypothetical protein
VAITSVAVEVWVLSSWNDQGHVGSGHGSCALIDCARSRPSYRQERVPRLGGPHGSPSCQRASRVPRARWKYIEGVGRFDDIMGARTKQKLPPEASISPEIFSQGSGGIEVDFRASSD